MKNGEPLFCLADLCRALDLDVNNTVRRLDDGVCSKHPISDSIGRVQLANFVNEDGFYDVILDSRKPDARRFRKWVTSEVLPSIRKTGGYGNQPQSDLTPAEHALFAIHGLFTENQTLNRQNALLCKRLEAANAEKRLLRAKLDRREERRQLLLEAPNYFSQFLEQTDLFNEINKRIPFEAIWVAFETFCLNIGVQTPLSRRTLGSYLTKQPKIDKVRASDGVYYFKP